MRTSVSFITALFLILPSLASAAAFGFPHQALWVSATTAHAGDSISVYAAVYNSTGDEMKGAVSFLADGTVFDTKDVDLAAGGSSLVTSAWSATEGSHSLSASFESGTQKDATDKIEVSISAAVPVPPPQPSVVDQTLSQATGVVQNLTTPSSPVAKVANAILNQTENLRTAGIDLLTPYANGTSNTVSTNSHATSSVASGFTKPTAASGAKSLVQNGAQLAAAATLFAFDTKWLFYLLLIVILFLILRAIKRWVNRPRF